MGNLPQEPIDRHKFTDLVVKMSVEIYVGSGCGLRTTVKIMKYLNLQLGWHLAEMPCYSSIRDWVEKSGYYLYKEPKLKTDEGEYAQIIDESMMIGSEKMLVCLGMKADKTAPGALTLNEVEVLDISVRKSWNSEGIAGVFSGTAARMGKAPAYIISDNASTITKGIRDKSYTHVRDIGHTLAMLVERQYKNDAAFQAWTKEVAAVKFRETMRPTSYLLPPKQRTIARFMNLSATLTWAKKVLGSFHNLTAEEQGILGFLYEHKPIITELNDVFERIDYVCQCLKKEGMSQKTVKTCLEELETLSVCASPRVSAVARQSMQYLKEEQDKLTGKETVWHASSDVIESLFGIYKIRKSPNALNGVTKYVMMLPLLTAINTQTGTSDICFKKALENVFLKDLTIWADHNLTDNLTIKRRNVLKAA